MERPFCEKLLRSDINGFDGDRFHRFVPGTPAYLGDCLSNILPFDHRPKYGVVPVQVCEVGAVVMKNWLPLVPVPAPLLAMAR